MKKIGSVYYGAKVPKPGTADRIHFVNVDKKACIGCKNCNEVCPTGAIASTKPSDRWAPSHIANPEMCIYCGQCLVNCPAHAIYEEISFIEPVRNAIADPGTITVAMPAPAIRYALGEEFGLTEGTYVGPKMFAALRALGFDYIWDVEFGADVTGKSYAGVKDYVGARIRAVYGHDRAMQYRKSQDNPFVKKLYGGFLPEPCCEKSRQLMHSSYTDRSANVRRIKDARSRLK